MVDTKASSLVSVCFGGILLLAIVAFFDELLNGSVQIGPEEPGLNRFDRFARAQTSSVECISLIVRLISFLGMTYRCRSFPNLSSSTQ